MNYLKNDCKCGNLSVFPKTWARTNASIKKDWYINYRFYDPLFKEKYPDGKQVRLKDMNAFHTLEERQDATRKILADELHLLKECEYNPITGTYKEPEPIIEVSPDYIISPDAGLCDAWQQAFARLEGEDLGDVKSTLKYITIAAKELRLDKTPVKGIKRRHAIMILDQCKKDKATFTEATYNRYLKNMRKLFKELVKVEAIENNPTSELEGKRHEKAVKVTVTPEEIAKINLCLPVLNYTFWRAIQIFCNSGARTPELMKVKREDVDLEKQLVTYTIRKGGVVRKATRPIKDCVLYLWQELYLAAKPGDYLFSVGLNPGPNAIRTDQMKHRWRKWVQIRLGIKATWYSLKHLNTDMMDELYGSDIAAHLNQHNTAMVDKHYAVNKPDRKNAVIKLSPNSFSIDNSDIKKPA